MSGTEFLLDALIFTAVMSVACALQGAVGFAGGLLSVPVLLWLGYGMPQAQAALLTATIVQNVWGLVKFHGTIAWRDLVVPGALRLLFLPVGVAALWRITELPEESVRQVVGAVLLGIVAAMIAFRPQPRERLAAPWAVVAFSASGFLQGLVGMGGPAIVLWVQAHDWSTQRSRAFLFSMYLIGIAPALGLLWYYFGASVPWAVAAAALGWPVMMPATSAGLRLGSWLGRERLRVVTFTLLAAIGVVNLLAPWIG